MSVAKLTFGRHEKRDRFAAARAVTQLE